MFWGISFLKNLVILRETPSMKSFLNHVAVLRLPSEVLFLQIRWLLPLFRLAFFLNERWIHEFRGRQFDMYISNLFWFSYNECIYTAEISIVIKYVWLYGEQLELVFEFSNFKFRWKLDSIFIIFLDNQWGDSTIKIINAIKYQVRVITATCN